jgi:tRNA threonylcarbamoyladenosine biosynthesis protein TsaB
MEPLLLAIESATRVASVALLRGERLLAERASLPGQHHAERLLPMLDELLGEQGVGLDQVDGFAVSIGPGSFTSLRIGLASVKGLAFGSDRPVAAVSTLEALAWSASRRADVARDSARVLVPLLDAGRGEVYAAAYRLAGEALERVLAEGVHEPEALARRMREPGLWVGEGAALFADSLAAGAGVSMRSESSPCSWPRAAVVGRLGARILAAGGGEAAADLVPRYLRRPQAEEAL